jgi:hypothetical protein
MPVCLGRNIVKTNNPADQGRSALPLFPDAGGTPALLVSLRDSLAAWRFKQQKQKVENQKLK